MDKTTVARIYSEQRAFMFGVALGRTRCPEDAEDVVQEAGILLMRQRTEPADERALAYTAVDYSERNLRQQRAARRRGGAGQAGRGDRRPPLEHPPVIESLDRLDANVGAICGHGEGPEPDESRHHPRVPSAEAEALVRMELAEVVEEAPVEVRMVAMGYTLAEVGRMTGQKDKAVAARVERWRAR